MFNKYSPQLGFSRHIEPFNQQMEYLSKEFKDVVHEDLNIYEFGKGLPFDENWVRSSFHHIESYPTRFIS
jgi:hypothetical protein